MLTMPMIELFQSKVIVYVNAAIALMIERPEHVSDII